MSLSEIARRFGTTLLLIARYAIRLQLTMNTKGSRSLGDYRRHRNPDAYLFNQTQECRNRWLKVIKNNPRDSRRDLMKKADTLYLWLQKHDSHWFNSHLPEQVKLNVKKARLDWERIDDELALKIATVCEEIIKRAGHKNRIEKRRLKLPRTTEVIQQKLETLEEFMLMKIELAKNEYIKQGIMPTKLQFMVKAVIRNTTTENSLKIQNSIVKALSEIAESGQF